jgi:hypothetical protein
MHVTYKKFVCTQSLGCFEIQNVIVLNLNIDNTIHMVIQINKENDVHNTFKMWYEYKQWIIKYMLIMILFGG